jgi:hypothetical protein
MKHYTPRVTRRPNAPTVKGLSLDLESRSEGETALSGQALMREAQTLTTAMSEWMTGLRNSGRVITAEQNALFQEYFSWAQTFAEWYRVNGEGSASWWDEMWGDTQDELAVYREQFQSYLRRFDDVGYTGYKPEVFESREEVWRKEQGFDSVSPEDLTRGAESISKTVKWVGIAVVAGLGIYGLTLVAPALRAGSKAAAKKMG